MRPSAPPAVSSSVEAFVRSIPKTETHLHIEGALPYELLVEWDQGRFPPEPYFRRASYRYPSFIDFENLLIGHAAQWFVSAERYHLAAKRIFGKLAAQNVKYVETSFHLHMAEFLGLDPREILAAIKSAAPAGMVVRVFGGMVRNGYTPVMKPIIDGLHLWEELDGIDLHGQEWLPLEDWAPPVWRRCAQAGKIVKAHAGEFGGPEKIREALDRLGARRIEHGVRAIEDAELVRRLAVEGAVLDICPLSNEKLGVYPDLEAHPIRALMDAGIDCTISTDDPLCFANELCDEYLALASRLGFDRARLGALASNGFKHARLDTTLKNKYMADIAAAVA